MSSHAATLALLPLENLSGSIEDSRLAKGFAQDLITELARFPNLGIIAADSVAAAGQGHADADLGRTLGAQFLLKGSVRRSGEALRVSVQLVEAQTGRHYWAGRYDEECLPTLQDEIAAKVANALAIQVDQSLLASTRQRQPTTLEAYECWLRGMESLHRGTAEADVEARAYFERALESDARYARAHAGLSLSHFNEWSCQAWDKWEEKERLAYEFAARAESLDPNDAVVQVILGRIEQYRREFTRVAPRLLRARTLAPNDANILIQLASCHAYQGDSELALSLVERALQLNPLCPPWFYCYAALPSFVARRYRESLDLAEKAPPQSIVDLPAYKAAALAYLERRDEAAGFLREFRKDFSARIACGREPDPEELLRWVAHVNPFRREEDGEHLAEGLRRAGLEIALSPTRQPLAWPIANAFRREGKTWTLAFEGKVAQLPDMRGLHDIARLLAEPGAETSSADLAGAAVQSRGWEAVDPKALLAYRRRVEEIDEEIESASVGVDTKTAESLEREREGILRELQLATGLGGRTRTRGGTDERSRTAVTWRIRHAIRKIAAVHPDLGRHLTASIKTGAFCSYEPERGTLWRV